MRVAVGAGSERWGTAGGPMADEPAGAATSWSRPVGNWTYAILCRGDDCGRHRPRDPRRDLLHAPRAAPPGAAPGSRGDAPVLHHRGRKATGAQLSKADGDTRCARCSRGAHAPELFGVAARLAGCGDDATRSSRPTSLVVRPPDAGSEPGGHGSRRPDPPAAARAPRAGHGPLPPNRGRPGPGGPWPHPCALPWTSERAVGISARLLGIWREVLVPIAATQQHGHRDRRNSGRASNVASAAARPARRGELRVSLADEQAGRARTRQPCKPGSRVPGSSARPCARLPRRPCPRQQRANSRSMSRRRRPPHGGDGDGDFATARVARREAEAIRPPYDRRPEVGPGRRTHLDSGVVRRPCRDGVALRLVASLPTTRRCSRLGVGSGLRGRGELRPVGTPSGATGTSRVREPLPSRRTGIRLANIPESVPVGADARASAVAARAPRTPRPASRPRLKAPTAVRRISDPPRSAT